MSQNVTFRIKLTLKLMLKLVIVNNFNDGTQFEEGRLPARRPWPAIILLTCINFQYQERNRQRLAKHHLNIKI